MQERSSSASDADADRPSSRVPGFYRLSLDDRHRELVRRLSLDENERALLLGGGLQPAAADHIVENVIGTYALPLGLGLNFQVNGQDYLVPMCVEEPSVIAAASNAARMVREGGGFTAEADPPLMIGQVQLYDVPDNAAATQAILAQKADLLVTCDAQQPGLLKIGGGARELHVRELEASGPKQPGMLVVHIVADCRDAMGANMVNTMAEAVAPRLATLARGRFGLRILSNLADRRLVRVSCRVPTEMLVSDGFSGAEVADGIVLASRFAELDPYRAATHNKGIMNGVDPVVIATGNDWRGIEAGAHSYAAREGVYRPLAIWRRDEKGWLRGQLAMPMAVATVGGTLRAHPGARLSLKILGVRTGTELGMVIGAVGLASNLAALRALAAEGIQHGHMALHARSVAVSAGATGALVDDVAAELSRSGQITVENATAILVRLRDQ